MPRGPRPSNQWKAFHRNGVTTTHREGNLARRETRLPSHDASLTGHTTAHPGIQQAAFGKQLHRPLSAEVHRGPPLEPRRVSSRHRHRGWPYASPRHHTAETSPADQSLTNRQVSRTARPAADPSYSTTIGSSSDCKLTLDVNKYFYICMILRLSLRTIMQHPI